MNFTDAEVHGRKVDLRLETLLLWMQACETFASAVPSKALKAGYFGLGFKPDTRFSKGH